jgi:starch synthase
VEAAAYREADAVIAVSEGMRADVLDAYPFVEPERVHVVRNGIDTVAWHPQEETNLLERYGVPTDRPYVVFVGRITRQKGIPHLLAAARQFDPSLTLVFCASAPDTPEIGVETTKAVEELRRTREVVWIQEHAPRRVVQQLLTHAVAFLCPSVYEPLGIVNLEAMACGTAVVASDVGGIPEVVDDGTTGLLVHYDAADAVGFETGLADAVNAVVRNPEQARTFGQAGRRRCIEEFSWMQVAQQTLDIYRSVCG